jgi:hypothetical protein
MTPIENDLAELMRERASAVEVAPPPTADLVRAGEAARRRRRSNTAAVAAAAIVLLLVVPWALLSHGHQDSSPPTPAVTSSPTPTATPTSTLASLPQGARPSAPYLTKRVLHVNGLSVQTSGDRLWAVPGLVLVQRWSATDPTWWRLQGHRLVEEPALQGVYEIGIAPQGDLIAWISNPTPSTTQITAWDPVTRREVGREDLPIPETCCDGGSVQQISVDRRHNVFWLETGGYRVWRPGTESPRPLTSGGRALAGAAPDGLISLNGALGKVDDRGRWTYLVTVPNNDDQVWSPDGTKVASGLAVEDVRTGRRSTLSLPPDADGQAVVFEDDEHVLVEASPPGQYKVNYILRCDITSGSCERSLDPGAKPSDWTFADSSGV